MKKYKIYEAKNGKDVLVYEVLDKTYKDFTFAKLLFNLGGVKDCDVAGLTYGGGDFTTRDEADKYSRVSITNDDGSGNTRKVYIDFYDVGYVLATGATTFLGSNTFLKSIGRRTASATVKGKCMVFKTKKDIINYINKHFSQFKTLANEGGWHFAVDFASKGFKADMEGKVDKHSAQLDALLLTINEVKEPEYFADDPISAELSLPQLARQEAIDRMKALKMSQDCINAFKKGNVWMSLGDCRMSGMLFETSGEPGAKEAIAKVEAAGHIPYHVIPVRFNSGMVWAVLFVSSNKEEWEMERPVKNGEYDYYIYSYCHNSDEPMFSEYGDIGIRPANGGLERIQ